MYSIRPIEEKDAQAFLELNQALASETQTMLWEPGENRTTPEEQLKRIRDIRTGENQMIFVAENGEGLVGFLAIFGNRLKRNRHCASVVIGIRKQFQNQGLGSVLFEKMETWARENNLQRLELTVMTHNANAIGLYRKFGFEIEGTRKKAILLEGQFIDEYYMGKTLNP